MADTPRSAEDVSVEIGASYIPIINAPAQNPAEAQVFACLFAHRREIAGAEKAFGVTRIAIAGAIAWEMLENVRKRPLRWVGYGKVHFFSFSLSWYDTAAKQVEDRGYLAPQSTEDRKLLLATPEGAIRYIAAIMAAIADISGRLGQRDIRFDAEIMTNVYQSMDLKGWESHLLKKPKGAKLADGNEMDRWVVSHLDFLVAAVGQPKS